MNSQLDKEFISEVKRNYLKAKQVLGVVSDADNMSYDAFMIRKATTIETAIKLEEFVKELENHGIQLLLTKN